MGAVQSAPEAGQTRNSSSNGYRAWNTLKLIALTGGWAIIQWLRCELERSHRRALENAPRSSRRAVHHVREDSRQQDKKTVFDCIPHHVRSIALDWIDQSVTPIIVDQWRLKLVEVLFGDAGSDQHLDGADLLRKQLLLKDLQDKIAASGRASQPSGSRGGRGGARAEAPPHLPARKLETPSAPPLPREEPSAPPYQDMPGPSTSTAQIDAARDCECAICMEATVNVEVQRCHHKMCGECAKAVVCMENRSPTCPFCRGPIDKFCVIRESGLAV